MNIKGLLLGSAAALAMGASAQAADLPVAAVSACPAGTLDLGDACLTISGSVTAGVKASYPTTANTTNIGSYASADLSFAAETETEMGTLSSTIGLETADDLTADAGAQALNVSSALIQLGGFVAGYGTTLAAAGEDYSTVMVGYNGDVAGLSYSLGLESQQAANNVDGMPTVAAALGYDVNDMFSVSTSAIYKTIKESDDDANTGLFAVAASATVTPVDALSLTLGGAYYSTALAYSDTNIGANGLTAAANYDAATAWDIYASASYDVTDTVALGLSADYNFQETLGVTASSTWTPVTGFSVTTEVDYTSSVGVESTTDYLIEVSRSF